MLLYNMNQAECDAYLEKAKLHLKNVTFRQGDVGELPYEDDIGALTDESDDTEENFSERRGR